MAACSCPTASRPASRARRFSPSPIRKSRCRIEFNLLPGNSLIGLLHVDSAKFDSRSGGVSPTATKKRLQQARITLAYEEALGFTTETTAAPKDAGVIEPRDYAIFQNHGYMGLYGGLDAQDIHRRKGLKKSQQILDRMGSTELAANLFRATQTEEKLRRERIQGKPRQTPPIARWVRRSEKPSKNSAARCRKTSPRRRASKKSRPSKGASASSRTKTKKDEHSGLIPTRS